MFFCHLVILTTALLAVPAVQKPSDVADAIAKIRAEWSKDLHDKRLDQIVMLYTPDAVFLPPNGARITGRAAIRELTKAAMDTFTSDLAFQSLVTDSSDTLAYDSGEFRETLVTVSDGSLSHGQGNYLMVFKRQADGSWLIAQQVWTESVLAH